MRASRDLFDVLEDVMKKESGAISALSLFEKYAEVKKVSNGLQRRVSDYLGVMWRRGLLVRYPAPRQKNDNTRWCYEWKGAKHKSVPPKPIEYKPKLMLSKYGIEIFNEGDSIRIESKDFNIVIRPKQSRGKGLSD